MSMKYIRETYGVPAKRGSIMKFQNKQVRILSSHAGLLKVEERCGKMRRTYHIHPTWETEYLVADGNRCKWVAGALAFAFLFLLGCQKPFDTNKQVPCDYKCEEMIKNQTLWSDATGTEAINE